MSRVDEAPADAAELASPRFEERPFRQFWALVSAVHHTPGSGRLYLLAVLITVVILATAAAQVMLNAWNQPFYDAIARKDVDEFIHQLVVFFGIAAVLLVLNVSQTGLGQMIRVKLRELSTQDLIGNWMTQKRAARISRAGEIGVNPDQRIHEDANHLSETTTGLALGLLQSSLLLVSFIGVLWTLSRGLVLNFGGEDFVIPGYMVWAALIYAATGSWFSWMIGRPLVGLSADRYAQEARFRFALVRDAEQADGIALNGSEAEEKRRLELELESVLGIARKIVFATVRLTTVTAGYGWVALVVPIIVAAPAYFGGSLTFGELMMVVGAFNQVQQSLRWFVDNTGGIADWWATLLRVMNFRQALLNLDDFETGHERFERVEHPEGKLALDDVRLMSFRGSSELSERHVEIAPGERVLVTGRAGAGKSTLFLAIAGLWNWGSGRISVPSSGDIMFLSQRPYLPLASLRSVLASPDQPVPSDEDVATALQRTGLDQLSKSLDQVERWDRELTNDEQQRLALARVLLKRPKWVVSDEALDLGDPTVKKYIVSIFSNELADTAVLSIAGNATANGFYSRTVELVTRGAPKPKQPAETVGAS